MIREIKKTLVRAVFDKAKEIIKNNIESAIYYVGFNQEMMKLKKSDLWSIAYACDMFDKTDIPDNDDRIEMENMWKQLVTESVTYPCPKFRMSLD